MSLTQFAMVEELASLIKDNVPCKHLVLTMEEALVNFLQDDTSSDCALELEPMSSYSRLLLHRLAEIFGFSHQSVGEGDDRHLILERCPETSIPSILVSDLLCQYDEYQSPVSYLLSRRKEVSQESQEEMPTFQFSIEDREEAYLAARKRIFSMTDNEEKGLLKQKPRTDPVVARRMIAHALGQRIKPSNEVVCIGDTRSYGEKTSETNSQENDILCGRNSKSSNQPKIGQGNCPSSSERNETKKLSGKPCNKVGTSEVGRKETSFRKNNLKEEHLGAAKRMFAHALGIHSRPLSKCNGTKMTD